MADDVILNPGVGGSTVATDDIGGRHFQAVKLTLGGDGTNDGYVSSSNPVPTLLRAELVDNAAFVDGTSRVVASGFIYDEVAGTALTEDDLAAARITVNRAQVMALEDGVTRGRYVTVTASNALKVDGSAVTQPVSDAGGSLTVDSAQLPAALVGGRLDVVVGAALPAGTNNIGDVDVLSVPAPLNLVGGGVEAAALRVTLASDSTGVLSVDDNGASLTTDTPQLPAALVGGRLDVVVGTELPAGTQTIGSVSVVGAVDTELPAPAALADATANPTVPTVGSALLAFNGATWDRLRGDTTNGVDVDVTRLPSLPAGTNNIGDVDVLTVPAPLNVTGGGVEASALRVTLASDSTGVISVDDNGASITVDAPVGTPLNVQIGDGTRTATVRDTGTSDALNVAVVDASGNQITGFGGGTQYTVDEVAPAAPTGTTILAERDDQLAALTEVEGDWTNLRATAKGALWVSLADPSGDPITSFGGGVQYTEDLAAAADPTGNMLLAVRADALAAVTTTDGDNIAVRATNNGEIYVKHVDSIPVTDNGGSLTVDNAALSVVGGGAEATALRVTIATDSTGVVSVDDNGASLTIDDGGASITVDGSVSVTGSVDTEMPVAAALADAAANPTTPTLGASLLLFNGATWDRVRGDTTNGIDVDVTRLPALAAGTNNIGDVDVLTVPAPLSTTGGGTEAAALRVTLASDSTGVLSIDDNGGSITVDNAGTFAVQDSQVIADNAAFTDGASKVFVSGFIYDEVAGTALAENDAAAGRINANRAQVATIEDGTTRGRYATVSASNALKVDGSAVTQPVSDAGGSLTVDAPVGTPVNVQIGDGTRTATVRDTGTSDSLNVSIVDASGNQITTFGGGTEYTVDAAAPAAPTGGTILAERDDQLAALTEVEGDWTNLRATSKGALWVALADAGGDPITSFGGGTQYTEDLAAAADPTGTMLMAVRADALAAVTTTDGDNVALRSTNNGELYVKHVDSIPVTDNGGSLTVDGTVTANLAAGTNNIGDVDVLTVPAPLNLVGGGVEAAALRVTLASDSTGVISVDDNGSSLSIDDGGASITVDGTVAISGAVDTELPTAAALADATGNPTTPLVGAAALLFNGTTWDRVRGDTANGVDVDVTRLPALAAGTNNIGDVDVLTVPAPLNVTGGGVEASALRVTLASDSTGLISVDDNGSTLSIDDGGASITVDGSVSVTGAVDTELPTAAALADAAANPTTPTVGAAALLFNGVTWDRVRGDTTNGVDVDVTRLPALAAGTNNIGDVDVLSVPAPLSTTGGGTEATALRVTLASDSTGVVSVDDNGSSLTVDAPVGTPVNVQIGDGVRTATVRDTGATDSLNVAIVDASGNQITSFGGGTQYTEDVAAAADPVGNMLMAVRADTLAAVTTLDGDNIALRATNNGELYVHHPSEGVVGQPIPPTATAIGGDRGGDLYGINAATNPPASGDIGLCVRVVGQVADNGAFVDGTTSVLPVGYIYDEVAGTALTENDVAAARINVNRAVVNTLEDGVTRGRYATITASNAVKVDGSAVTQPVSGTVTANLAAGTNNIGDVDVLTMTGTAAESGALPSSYVVVAGDDGTNTHPLQIDDTTTGLKVVGAVAHDAVDAGGPFKAGARAIAHGTNPTAVAAADLTHLYANRAGVLFTIGGHPNIICRSVRIADADGAQTNASIAGTINTGAKVVLTSLSITCDSANTGAVACKIGFGTATIPADSATGAAGVVVDHEGIAPGSGIVLGNGGGIIGIGADDEELRLTCEDPAGGFICITFTYFTIES